MFRIVLPTFSEIRELFRELGAGPALAVLVGGCVTSPQPAVASTSWLGAAEGRTLEARAASSAGTGSVQGQDLGAGPALKGLAVGRCLNVWAHGMSTSEGAGTTWHLGLWLCSQKKKERCACSRVKLQMLAPLSRIFDEGAPDMNLQLQASNHMRLQHQLTKQACHVDKIASCRAAAAWNSCHAA